MFVRSARKAHVKSRLGKVEIESDRHQAVQTALDGGDSTPRRTRKYADVFEVRIPRQHEVVHAGICMDKQAAAGE